MRLSEIASIGAASSTEASTPTPSPRSTSIISWIAEKSRAVPPPYAFKQKTRHFGGVVFNRDAAIQSATASFARLKGRTALSSAFAASWWPTLACRAIAASGRGLCVIALTEVGAAEMATAAGIGNLALRFAQQCLCIGLAHEILLNGWKTQPECRH
jgi:hypothetical protein